MFGPVAEEDVVRLERWDGPWQEDDPDANFKSDVALYSLLDPMSIIRALSASTGVPAGALCRSVLARWCSSGSATTLQLGPSTVDQMWDACVGAEREGTTEARLAAYEKLRQMLSWLRAGPE